MNAGVVIAACILFFLPFLIVFGVFLIAFHREPRRLRCGVLLAVSGILFAIALLLVFAAVNEWYPDLVVARIVSRAVPVLLGLVGILPAGLLILTLVMGIWLLITQGLHMRNAFSVLFSVGMIIYVTVWPLLGDLHLGRFSTMLYIYISGILSYTILLKTILALTSELNLHHRKGPKGLEYVVVLGRPLKREPVVKIVHERIDKGIEVYRMNPGAKLVLAGGWKSEEGVAVCEEMAVYAREQGVPVEDILLETTSDSTAATVTASWALIMQGRDADDKPKMALASSAYHVVRALIIARKAGIPCIGYGARTNFGVSTNAFVREYMLYLKLTRKGQIALLIVYTGLYWGASAYLMQSGIFDPAELDAGTVLNAAGHLLPG